ncbi:hypothetical protein K3495_g13050 [Podosphaera aphanis]|nr:hypothetical protein K3495_g13050 [Podosphaera aphanis]
MRINSKPVDSYKEKNFDDASLKEKVNDLTQFIDSCKFGILTTRDSSTGTLASRCMVVAAKENDGIDLVFYTNSDSGKTNDIQSDPHVNVAFLDSSGQWASISGVAKMISDPEIVKKHYFPTLRGWMGDLGDGKHDGGPSDPRLSIIKVETKTVTYAITRMNALSRGVEVAQSVVTGKAPAIHKLREINEQEVLVWRCSRKMVE